MDDESYWQKQLLVGLAMLLVVGVLIGGIVAFAGIKVADLAGLNKTATTAGSGEHLHVPRNAETPTTPVPTTAAPPSSSTATTAPPTHQPPRQQPFTLTISPTTVSPYERINLTGTYAVPDGTSLQVQRQESGSWADFPTTASVTGGRFTTYIQTGHTGLNRLRMTDTASGRSSEVATVTVQ